MRCRLFPFALVVLVCAMAVSHEGRAQLTEVVRGWNYRVSPAERLRDDENGAVASLKAEAEGLRQYGGEHMTDLERENYNVDIEEANALGDLMQAETLANRAQFFPVVDGTIPAPGSDPTAAGISKVGAACRPSLPGRGLRTSRLNSSRSRNMSQTASCNRPGWPLNALVSRARKAP